MKRALVINAAAIDTARDSPGQQANGKEERQRRISPRQFAPHKRGHARRMGHRREQRGHARESREGDNFSAELGKKDQSNGARKASKGRAHKQSGGEDPPRGAGTVAGDDGREFEQ